MPSLDLLVIQPTPFCNINCSYCYLADRSNKGRISFEIINRIIDSIIKDNLTKHDLSIVWHAGEPLVLSPSFYRPLFQLFESRLSPLGISIHHSIQTNGTLIDQEWGDFILEFNIKIGLSIDGPQHIHDSKRITRSGKGTFEKVMDGITLLQKNHIRYHGIAVVSEKSVDYPKELFDFFYTNGFYNLGLNIEEIEGINVESLIFSKALFMKVKSFYEVLFDCYVGSDKHMRIREFDNSFSAILRNPETPDITKVKINSHQNIALSIISVDYQGNFSTFSPELIGQSSKEYNNFIFGNILQNSFGKSLKNPVLKQATNQIIKGLKKCKNECEYFFVCGGGAPANKYFENGSFNSSETNYCKYNIQLPVDLAVQYMEKNLQIN